MAYPVNINLQPGAGHLSVAHLRLTRKELTKSVLNSKNIN